MTEKDMWLSIRGSMGDIAHLTRIENAASFGTPDINAAYDGTEFWLETKIAHSGKFQIRPSQLAWYIKHTKHNRNVFFLVYEKGEYYLYRPYIVELQKALESYNGVTKVVLQHLTQFDAGPPTNNWYQMIENIVHELQRRHEGGQDK